MCRKRKQLISLLAQPTAFLQTPIWERLRSRHDKGAHIVHWQGAPSLCCCAIFGSDQTYCVVHHCCYTVVILFSDLEMRSQPMSYKHDAFRATVAHRTSCPVTERLAVWNLAGSARHFSHFASNKCELMFARVTTKWLFGADWQPRFCLAIPGQLWVHV